MLIENRPIPRGTLDCTSSGRQQRRVYHRPVKAPARPMPVHKEFHQNESCIAGGRVPDILGLIVATWEEMPAPGADDQEDDITIALCRALRQNRTARTLPFLIHTQLVELEPAIGEDLGRQDIVFIPLIAREDIYFCIESKRLNVVKDGKMRTYASEYVTHGMLRFVTGQYSKAVRHAG